MRDFYDIHILMNIHAQSIDFVTLKEAFTNTSEKRGSISLLSDATLIVDEIADDQGMIDLWHRYQHKFDYATDVHWNQVMESVSDLVKIIK